MKQAKQKDILELLKPYSMQVLNESGLKVVKMDEFIAICIKSYAKQLKAVNVKYVVEYKN